MSRGRVRLDPDIRFERYTKKTERCWLWTGAVCRDGYGCFNVDGRSFKAHRWAWIRAHGPIPAGLVVMHRCDNHAPRPHGARRTRWALEADRSKRPGDA
jgi:hypothetical protein